MPRRSALDPERPFSLPADRPALMGILNVTPDSFSDGGLHFSASSAIEAAMRMMDEGADLIDVGGESTRPGSEGVDEDEELRRVMPVIETLVNGAVPISIDTSKAAVARKALGAGAVVVNDVTALGDPDMAEVCAAFECHVCLMHMRGEPRTMQIDPHYEDVVEEVRDYLLGRAVVAEVSGIPREKIWIDPGIGFGKTASHNLLLLKYFDRLVDLGYPVLVGVSRKSFIGRVLAEGEEPLGPQDRLEGTLAAQAWAQAKGARIIRAHDVRAARRTIDMLAAIAEA